MLVKPRKFSVSIINNQQISNLFYLWRVKISTIIQD